MPAARAYLRGAPARKSAFGHHGPGGREADAEGSERAGSLHGRDPAHDHHWLVRDQWHGARDRFAAAPLAGSILRARSRQDALFGQAAVLGTRYPVSRLVARFRVRPEGLFVFPGGPPPQDAGDDTPQGPRFLAGESPRRIFHVRYLPSWRGGY